MKLSIITPSYNSATTIERAINSVLDQNYDAFEHIIIDGGSSDETLEILQKNAHLLWISEDDRGQVDAMNKGFALATGDLIGYLNSDDYYLPGTFEIAISQFRLGVDVVMGKVLVRSEKQDGIEEWICDPKTEFESILRHWEPNAFCVNPVGYFYRRQVQQCVPFRESTGAKHDLDFLLRVARLFYIRKIDAIFGVFNHALDTKTAIEQLFPSYWSKDNFSFVDDLLPHVSKNKRESFNVQRELGYQLRRHWTVAEAVRTGRSDELFRRDEVFLLPEERTNHASSSDGFREHTQLVTKNDWIVLVVSRNTSDATRVCDLLRGIRAGDSTPLIYCAAFDHTCSAADGLAAVFPDRDAATLGLALRSTMSTHKYFLKWKFVLIDFDWWRKSNFPCGQPPVRQSPYPNGSQFRLNEAIASFVCEQIRLIVPDTRVDPADLKVTVDDRYMLVSSKEFDALVVSTDEFASSQSLLNPLKRFFGVLLN